MSQGQNKDIAQRLLAAIGGGSDPDDIAALFSVDVELEIPGSISKQRPSEKCPRTVKADSVQMRRMWTLLWNGTHFSLSPISIALPLPNQTFTFKPPLTVTFVETIEDPMGTGLRQLVGKQ